MGRGVSIISILIVSIWPYTTAFSAVQSQPQKKITPIAKTPAVGLSSAGSNRSNLVSPAPRSRRASPASSETSESSFQELLRVYRAKAFNQAQTEIKRLQGQKGTPDEIPTYLLAEIHLKQAEDGEQEALPQAMALFKKAVTTYPKSNHVLFGYLRIGQIYGRQKLFYEAIASFKRILKQPSQSRFALQAQVEMARTYQAWGKWSEAEAIYASILPLRSFSVEERAEVRLGYADVLYQIGRFEEAYQHYKMAALAMPSYRFKDPIALFQFAEAAYRERHYPQAKGLFLQFYNIYPKEPFAPVALVRFGTLLKMEKRGSRPSPPVVTPNLSSIDDTIHLLASTLTSEASRESSDLSQILLSISALKECAQRTPSRRVSPPVARVALLKEEDTLISSDNLVPCDLPLAEEAFAFAPKWRDPFRQEIRTHAMSLLEKPLPSTTSQGVILEAIEQLKKQNEIGAVVELEAALLFNLPVSSPYRKEVQDDLRKTIANHLSTISDPMVIVTLFHTYPAAFTKEMLAGDIGFVIATSHARVGLSSRAVDLFLPIAKNYKHPASDESLYQIGKISLQLGDDEKAELALEQYQRRSSPARARAALPDLGELYFKQGKIEKAILAFEHWLFHYPKHPQKDEVYLKLSEVYRYQNDYDNEIKVYLRWIQNSKEVSTLPHSRLADAYFQSGQYQKAIPSYKWIVDQSSKLSPGKGWKKDVEWAQLRLAMSYESLGQHEDGKRLFKKVAKKAKDPLIKKMAQDKLRS